MDVGEIVATDLKFSSTLMVTWLALTANFIISTIMAMTTEVTDAIYSLISAS